MSKSKRREAKKAANAAKAAKKADGNATQQQQQEVPDTEPDWKDLKAKKAVAKGQFSRAKNKIMWKLNNYSEEVEEELIDLIEKTRYEFDKFIECLLKLLEAAKKIEDKGAEIVNIEAEMNKAEEEVNKIFLKLEDIRNSHSEGVKRAETARYEFRNRNHQIEESNGASGKSDTTRRMSESRSEITESEILSVRNHSFTKRQVETQEGDELCEVLSNENEREKIETARRDLEDLYQQRREILETKMQQLRASDSTSEYTRRLQFKQGHQNINEHDHDSYQDFKSELEDRERRVPIELTSERRPVELASGNRPNPKDPQLYCKTEDDNVGLDMLKQLKRVPIPTFYGDKKVYASWKAAFYSCVDAANITPEYKLLQLRSYLRGEALKSIELFGHSAEAYEASKRQLERKFGGERRQIALRLEELDQFKPIRPGCPKDVEKLADLLEVLVVTMKDAGRKEELGDGTLYLKLQKKLTEEMLTKYRRWTFETNEVNSVEALKRWLLRESEYQNVAFETLRGLSDRSQRPRNETPGGLSERSQRPRNEYNHLVRNSPRSQCAMCSESHPIWTCPSFKILKVDERWELAKSARLCFCCLAATHSSRDCLRAKICGMNNCRKNHHRLLHQDDITARRTSDRQRDHNDPDHQTHNNLLLREPDNHTDFNHDVEQRRNPYNPFLPNMHQYHSDGQRNEEDGYPEPPQERTHNNYSRNLISLRTIPVIVKRSERCIKINALLDDGSTKTYVNTDIASELDLCGQRKTVNVGTLGGVNRVLTSEEVSFTIISVDGKTTQEISALTTTKVTGNMKATNWHKNSRNWIHLQEVDFPIPAKRVTVDLLIGSDYIQLHTALEEIEGQRGEPIARRTPLGWTCVGRVNPVSQEKNESYFSFMCNEPTCEEFRLEKFWETEEIPNNEIDYMSKEEQDAVEMAKASLVKNENGRFQIGSPWKSKRGDVTQEYKKENNVEEIPNNFKSAFNRLITTEKSVMKKGVETMYSEVFAKYLKKDYIRRVDGLQDRKKTKWLLAHFPIYRLDKDTTKIRAVFDASAKYQELCLNDFVLKGPNLQQDLFTILCRFRNYPVAIVCDITEMYLQVELAPEDRKYFRFLWRNFEDRSPDVYEFNRLVFGFSACPFLAQFVARENAVSNQEELPLASEAVLKSTYMDDTLDSVEDEATGKRMYRELTELWGRAGMSARKWLSNSEEVLKEIPESERAASVDLDNSELPCSKTLGVSWMADIDAFTFKILSQEYKQGFSKRTFLSIVAAVFDPLGFLVAFVIIAKILLQEIWLQGLNWDDKLPPEIDNRIRTWCDDLTNLSNIRVPRCVRLTQKPVHYSLHLFSDASKEAYATVAYLRTEYENQPPCTRLVASKSKVAPLKVTSIPRLELMGATLSVRLSSLVSSALNVEEKNMFFWTDSMNVLWWISRRSKTLKTFVANRVGLIHRKSLPSQWRHVDGKENPADKATRGLTVAELSVSTLWWDGPEFLKKDAEEWPGKMTVSAPIPAKREEIKKWKKEESSFHSRVITFDEETRLNPTRYSTMTRLVRVTAWVLRFIENCQHLSKENRSKGELTVEELSDSEHSIIKSMQKTAFHSEIEYIKKNKSVQSSSKIVSFQPFIDDDGLLRANSRLANAEYLPYNIRYPIVLARKEWVTKLIIRSYHSRDEHTKGTNHTLSLLSEKYVMLQAREEIRTTEDECNNCKRKKSRPGSQIMAPLPVIRLKEPLHAFNKISVDYAGPFDSIQGRGRRRAKRYLCLFTCLLSRAVHLEIAYSLDTDSFLNAFYRMTSRRGLPEEAISDNGSNFTSGNRELQELVDLLDKDKIYTSLANKGIKWTFNPPLAPHFGGVHESMIKSAKRAIYAVLHNADINDEELHSAFVGVEDLLNSRPLTYQSSHPADCLPLTPNHFLHGRVGGEFAADTVDDIDFAARKRWRRVQELVRHVWSRWMKEWVPELRRRKKWNTPSRNFQIGDLVLIIDSSVRRGQWNMGKVEEVYPGKDDRVRTVKVRVKDTTYIRSITKLCHLELSNI